MEVKGSDSTILGCTNDHFARWPELDSRDPTSMLRECYETETGQGIPNFDLKMDENKKDADTASLLTTEGQLILWKVGAKIFNTCHVMTSQCSSTMPVPEKDLAFDEYEDGKLMVTSFLRATRTGWVAVHSLALDASWVLHRWVSCELIYLLHQILKDSSTCFSVFFRSLVDEISTLSPSAWS